MPNEKKVYRYVGPVVRFNICVANQWKGETVATSLRKAKSNLAYQFKKQLGLTSSAGTIDFPGSFHIEEV
jgi:hypothetical protein